MMGYACQINATATKTLHNCNISGGEGIRTLGTVLPVRGFSKAATAFRKGKRGLKLRTIDERLSVKHSVRRSDETPADLAAVVDAWDGLPAALRAGILAMVNATGVKR
jgi:hypothetical protein